MKENLTRLSRLTSILTILQSKKLVTATELSKKFTVSIRTIYRDIKSLEEAGIPILSEEGKGYILMEGFKIPPIMFSETEANALITAEKMVIQNKDSSFIKEFSNAITKIKAVLNYSTKEKTTILFERIAFLQNETKIEKSNYLIKIQEALTNFLCIEIHYSSIEKKETTKRIIEPFALYHTKENWVLVAYCQLRNEFRAFRLDKINSLIVLQVGFNPHNLTLQQYFESCKN